MGAAAEPTLLGGRRVVGPETAVAIRGVGCPTPMSHGLRNSEGAVRRGNAALRDPAAQPSGGPGLDTTRATGYSSLVIRAAVPSGRCSTRRPSASSATVVIPSSASSTPKSTAASRATIAASTSPWRAPSRRSRSMRPVSALPPTSATHSATRLWVVDWVRGCSSRCVQARPDATRTGRRLLVQAWRRGATDPPAPRRPG